MLSAGELFEYMPHNGSMRLIQKLIEWDEENIVCHTRSHLSRENPLRKSERLSAIHAVEYGAQAIGLHSVLLAKAADETPRSGLLVALRQVKLERARLDDTEATLVVSAHRLLADPHNLLYAFALSLNQEPVAEGRVAIITQSGVDA